MNHFARHGFDVWTMDHEGYGKSSRTDRNSNIGMAVEDLDAAMTVVERETGQKSAHFYGQSSGSLRAALFAQTRPHRVRKLVLDAFVWTGAGSPTLAKRKEQLHKWRASHVRQIDEAFMHSIFNRDKPGTSEPAVADAVAKAQLKYGDTIPTGTYLDMCANLPIVEPEKITCPVLILRGEHDGIAAMDDLLAFFQRLPNMDKHLSVLSGSAHIAPFGLNYRRFYHIVFAFLDMPESACI
jgi:pimeloyl-ACP methyl ester carboxylesterase